MKLAPILVVPTLRMSGAITTAPMRLHAVHIVAYCNGSVPSCIRLALVILCITRYPKLHCFNIGCYICVSDHMPRSGWQEYASLLRDLVPKYLEYEACRDVRSLMPVYILRY